MSLYVNNLHFLLNIYYQLQTCYIRGKRRIRGILSIISYDACHLYHGGCACAVSTNDTEQNDKSNNEFVVWLSHFYNGGWKNDFGCTLVYGHCWWYIIRNNIDSIVCFCASTDSMEKRKLQRNLRIM